MTPWNYLPLFRGATGGYAGPESHGRLPGAHHPNVDEIDGAKRNAYSRVPGRGLAASLPAESTGTVSGDAAHIHALEGYKHSVVANHPDGQFELNTAATSSHSHNANLKILTGDRPGGYRATGRTYNVSEGMYEAQDRDNTRSIGVLRTERAANKNDWTNRDQVFIRPGAAVLNRGWTGSEVGMLALGGYAAMRVLAR